MKVMFSTINHAYVIIAGDTLVDLDGQRFWASLDELRSKLRGKGLVMNPDTRMIETDDGGGAAS